MELLEAIKEWAPVGIMIGAGIWGFIYGVVKSFFKKKKLNIDTDVKFSIPIYNILIDLLFFYPATRTFIKQFHNGSQFYSGQHIQRLSISHEKCRPGVDPIKQNHDNIQVPVEVHEILKEMDYKKKVWVFIDDVDKIEEEHPELYRWMKEYGVVSILYFRLFDTRTSSTIGLLGLTFNHKFRLDENVDINDIMRKKRNIESEFNKI